MSQLKLMFHMDEELLSDHLEKATKKKISLTVTDNSSSMLSTKTRGSAVSVRVNRIFLFADSEVIDEIAGFIVNSRVKTPRIREYIRKNTHLLKRKPPRKVNIKTAGTCYNLLDMFHSINMEYFEGKVSAFITWGLKGHRRAAARRTLGSYCSDNNTIRINPVLDKKRIPRYFLEFIVYHEMLHADMGIRTDTARRSMHSKEFRKREKMFKHYDRAIAWEKEKW